MIITAIIYGGICIIMCVARIVRDIRRRKAVELTDIGMTMFSMTLIAVTIWLGE